MKPYLGEEDELPSRTTSFQEGEDDEDINTIVTPTTPTTTYTGPITRARARQLNYQVLLFLGNDCNVHEPTQQVPSETPVEHLYNHPVTL